MTVIEMTFPCGKVHATPWGRQVNEGATEWPPSPWRLLRALLSVWHMKHPDVPEADVRRLICLLTPLPQFHLPPATMGHTRHYVPTANDQRTKIFDTFVAVDRSAPVRAVWPDVVLTQPDRELLATLLESMTYFGRAESWVEARLLDAWTGTPNALPVSPGSTSPRNAQQILAVISEAEFSGWRSGALDGLRQQKLKELQDRDRAKGNDPAKTRLKPADESKILRQVPQSLFEALHADTDELRGACWSRPPGSQWVYYDRPANTFASLPRRNRRSASAAARVARYALSSAVLPKLTEAVAVGEFIRMALMSCSRRVQGEGGVPTAAFSGKSPDGTPSLANHEHAHILCEANGKGLDITHVTVFAPGGFLYPVDHEALGRLRTIPGMGRHAVHFALLGIGQPEEFGGNDVGQSPVLGEAKEWVSRTPYVPQHHLRIRRSRTAGGRDAQVCEELIRLLKLEFQRRPWMEPLYGCLSDVIPVVGRDGGAEINGKAIPWLKFKRQRFHGKGHRGTNFGYGFRLVFSRPVRGPIVLGYGCHFGLGQFVPDASS